MRRDHHPEKRAFEGLGLANSAKRAAPNIFDQGVDLFDRSSINVLPVQIAFPGI
jgi:hypothetical protein